MKPKRATIFRLTPEALKMLAAIADKSGISQSAVLETLIREKGSNCASVKHCYNLGDYLLIADPAIDWFGRRERSNIPVI